MRSKAPEVLAAGRLINESHLGQLPPPVQFVMLRVSLLPQVLHVDAHQHLAQLHEVAVVFVLDCERSQQRVVRLTISF